MAPLISCSKPKSKVLVLSLLLFLFTSVVILSVSTESLQLQPQNSLFRRKLLDLEDVEEDQPKKKSPTSSSSSKPNQSAKNQTKLVNKSSSISAKNQIKLSKPSNSTKSSTSFPKSELKKLNSTSLLKMKKSNSTSSLKLNSTSKSTNSTKISSLSSKKSLDLTELSSPKNKTTKSTPTAEKKQISSESPKPKKTQNTDKSNNPEKTQKTKPKQKQPSWIDQDDDDENLVSEFRDLPSRFQKTLIPDLRRISTTSKAYINKYNKQITNQFKPIVGHRNAPTIATAVSFTFILIPLVLVSLVFNQIKAYFSLQKVLIFIQAYLSIYFSILCLSSLVTGLEPLRFFYATSRSTYICLQVLQTLGYVLYLLLLLMYLVLVFSTKCGLGSKLLGLGQTFVGFSVGLHYYVAVFHRVVLREPPRTNWKIHGIYATCFFVVAICANAERRKKAYLEESGEEGKVN